MGRMKDQLIPSAVQNEETRNAFNDGYNAGNQMIDITAPKQVEVRIRIDGEVLWVNVDGVCRLRICGMQPSDLTINDERNI